MKKKTKGGKKSKTSTKRKVSVSSDEEPLSVAGSLPPSVEGQLRCFLRVSIGQLTWDIPEHPDDVIVKIKWWGEEGEGAKLRPLKKKREAVYTETQWSSVRYPVCSGPKQFASYLKDMGTLILEFVHGAAHLPLGQVLISEIVNLTASTPIHGFYPVMSPSRPSSKVAEIHVTLKFESVSAAYNKFSSAIPTVDTALDNKENVHDDNAPHPTPPPYANPATPVTHPRHQPLTHDPFVSPAPAKGVKFSSDPPARHEYTIDPGVLSLLENEFEQRNTSTGEVLADVLPGKSLPSSHPATDITILPASNIPGNPVQSDTPTQPGISGDTDWIGALLEKGQKLREGMVKTALLEDAFDQDTDYIGHDKIRYARHHVLPGQLFKEILSKNNISPQRVPSELLSHTLEEVDDHTHSHSLGTEDKAIDLLMGDHDVGHFYHSLDDSEMSDELSDTGDPVYDESLLGDLFYTTPANKTGSDSELEHTISSDDDANLSASLEDAGNMRLKRRYSSPKDEHRERKKDEGKRRTKSRKSTTKDYSGDNSVGITYEHADMPIDEGLHSSEDTTSTLTTISSTLSTITGSSVSGTNKDTRDLVHKLGADTLTVLGRINTARVVIESLYINTQEELKNAAEQRKPSTFLVEYHFPAVSPAKDHRHDVAMATEVTRIASKKLHDGVVSFGHRSVFPVFFNATIAEHWWSLALTFRLFRRDSGHKQPFELGVGALPLKSVLLSSDLSVSTDVEIKQKRRLPSDESTSSVASSERVSLGNLKVKLELGVDGNKVHVTPRTSLAEAPTLQPHPPTVAMVTKPVVIAGSQMGQQYSSVGDRLASKPPFPRGPSPVKEQQPALHLTHDASEVHTLHSLLWIPEGRGITSEPHSNHGNRTIAPGLASRTNPYLVCRMFWWEDVSRSAVMWATNQPQFAFKQIVPVLLTLTLLQRACNNFIVIEVWDKAVPQGDKLIGIAKLPLHQLYLSYRDPKITKTLMKSKYPVVCVDEWINISNPFTSSQHGQLKVLLAMGTDEQISSFLVMRGEEGPTVSHHEKPAHHLDNHRDIGHSTKAHTTRLKSLVEHQFEVVIEEIRGLSVFRSTVWGETDCYVQYHFPFQDQSVMEEGTEDVPALKAHRTTTTLCVPDPSFQDVARHSFFLPAGIPVQRYLLASFSGSWTGVSTLPGMGGVPFELWRRYYYPNVRDQLVAKASLPVAKLCAMVTMQKHREPSVQGFSLPLLVLPGDDQADGKAVVQDTGLLNIHVRYRHQKVSNRDGGASERQDKLCLSLDIIRACGLKAAAACEAETNSAMAYPADVGVNAYVVIKLPVGRKSSYTTRTVARTFAPEFTHHMEVMLPVTISRKEENGDQEGPVCLAEQLETNVATLEVW